MTPHPLRPAAQQVSESCDTPERNASKGDSKDMLSSQRIPGMRLAGKCLDPCLPLSFLLTARFPYQTVYGRDYMLSCLTEHWSTDVDRSTHSQTSTSSLTDMHSCRALCLALPLENSSSPIGCSSLATSLDIPCSAPPWFPGAV